MTGLGFQGLIHSHFQDLFCHQLTARPQTYVTDVTGPRSQNTSEPGGIPQRSIFRIIRCMFTCEALGDAVFFPRGLVSSTAVTQLCIEQHMERHKTFLNLTTNNNCENNEPNVASWLIKTCSSTDFLFKSSKKNQSYQ